MKKNGFTLIELIIVVIIIGILASIIIPSMNRAVIEADIAELRPGTSIDDDTLERIIDVKVKQDLTTEQAVNIILGPKPKGLEEDLKKVPAEVEEADFESVDKTGNKKSLAGIIIFKAEVSYKSNDGSVTIEEYWFRVRRFNNKKLIWVLVGKKVYDNKWRGLVYEG